MIVIEIDGGLIQRIYTNAEYDEDREVIIVDHDIEGVEDKLISKIDALESADNPNGEVYLAKNRVLYNPGMATAIKKAFGKEEE